MSRAVLALALLAAGCAADVGEPGTRPLSVGRSEQALEDWIAHGNVEGNCREHLDEIQLEEMPTEESAQSRCRAPVSVLGCTDGNVIVYDGGQSATQLETTIEHELRHWLGGCAYGLVDGNHEHTTFWYPDRRGRSVL